MANQEHLDILKQGVQAWNEWRAKNSAVQIDLSYAYLRDAQLSNANLSRTDLSRTDLFNADFSYALQLHFLSTALMVLKKEKKTLESFS